MRRSVAHRVTLLAAGVALVATACTSHDTSDPVTRTGRVTDAGVVARTLSAAFRPYPVHLLSPREARGLTSLPWNLHGMSSDGRDLEISYIAGGGCTGWRGMEVSQNRSAVVIAALGKTAHGEGCGAVLVGGATTIRLDAPLGRRVLLHAAVDRDWTAYQNAVP